MRTTPAGCADFHCREYLGVGAAIDRSPRAFRARIRRRLAFDIAHPAVELHLRFIVPGVTEHCAAHQTSVQRTEARWAFLKLAGRYSPLAICGELMDIAHS